MGTLLPIIAAGLGIAIVAVARPVIGLTAYFGVLLLFPDYLRVSLGSIDLSAARLVATALLIRGAADPNLSRRFQWSKLDTCVLLYVLVGAAALLCTVPTSVWLENRSGFLMDTFFAYLAVRLVLVDRAAVMTLIKGVALMTAFLAVHGVVETFTGRSLYAGLGAYCPWAPTKGMVYQTRFGLNRAMGPPGETILFGLTFAAIVPLVYLLRHERGLWAKWAVPLTLTAIMGVASTVSSGPYLGLIVVILCLSLERMRSMVYPLLGCIALGCIGVELTANRHFYHVLGDFTMDGESAWYRARLIDIAIARVGEYWMYGYGFTEPGWGWDINGLKKTDVVNDYVYQAVLYGLGGLAVYVIAQAQAIATAVQRFRLTRDAWGRSLCWASASALIGLMASSWSVALFGQLTTFYFCLLGVLGSLPVLVPRVTGAMPAPGAKGPAHHARPAPPVFVRRGVTPPRAAGAAMIAGASAPPSSLTTTPRR